MNDSDYTLHDYTTEKKCKDIHVSKSKSSKKVKVKHKTQNT